MSDQTTFPDPSLTLIVEIPKNVPYDDGKKAIEVALKDLVEDNQATINDLVPRSNILVVNCAHHDARVQVKKIFAEHLRAYRASPDRKAVALSS